ncbi:Glycerate dehydrogenase protein [Rutstroemia sp. NJR-2017a WRK4]|nr:Glycerate dehydrogenase protein [Rutstroemia sp. NJR-2017a WRK4]
MSTTPTAQAPTLPPTLHILRLDPIHHPSPDFTPLPHPYTYTELSTPPPPAEELLSHLHPAHILLTTRFPLPSTLLSQLPNLMHIGVIAIGTDHIDLEYCKEHHISVSHVPAASNEAVSEHALALYFALRRNIVGMHELTSEGREWVQRGSLTGEFWGGLVGGLRREVVGIVGGGELGTRVANLCRSLSMHVQISERPDHPPSLPPRPNRTPFPTILSTSTILFLTLPLTPSTHNLLTYAQLSLLPPTCLVINIARGGIVNEADLVRVLQEGKIAGAATDVFEVEPAGEENVLVEAAREDKRLRGRLILTPHVAWWGRSSVERLREVSVGNVVRWVRGERENRVV